jgi:hypothetical protein
LNRLEIGRNYVTRRYVLSVVARRFADVGQSRSIHRFAEAQRVSLAWVICIDVP